MRIHYDFIAYSSRASETDWIIGMRAIQGEVPLDIVIPDQQTSSDPENPEIVGVLTVEGLERQSNDGLELYHYLRRLNPKKNETSNYNEVVIRNIHSRLSSLRVNQELRVQIAYTERKDPYARFSYQIKLLGTSDKSDVDVDTSDNDAQHDAQLEIASPQSEDKRQDPEDERNSFGPSQPVYRTTNTLEKLITFTQNMQKELDQTQKQLGAVINKVQQFDDYRQQLQDLHNMIEEILNRISRLENLNARIQYLETDRHQLQDLQQTLRKFLVALNQQTRVSLQEHDENTMDE